MQELEELCKKVNIMQEILIYGGNYGNLCLTQTPCGKNTTFFHIMRYYVCIMHAYI